MLYRHKKGCRLYTQQRLSHLGVAAGILEQEDPDQMAWDRAKNPKKKHVFSQLHKFRTA